MIYAQPQSEGAVSQLASEIKNADSTKWYRRLKIVQLSMAGKPVGQLATEFDVCQATVRSYIKSYNSGGIDGLRPHRASGRPPKIGQLSRDEWSEILRQTPDQYDRLETNERQWSLNLLVGYAKEYLGQEVCFQTVSTALRRCKYRTGRSKLRVGSPDPDYLVKRQNIETLGSFQSRGN